MQKQNTNTKLKTKVVKKTSKTKSKEAVINFRTKESVKKEASKIFEKMGLDMSSALNVFLHNVIIRKAMPMNIITENGYTLAREQEIIAMSKDEEGVKIYEDMKDFWRDVEFENN